MFKVFELLKATRGELVSGGKDTPVRGISIDSRTVKKGEAFIAIKGDNFDGQDFIPEAARRGASCLITQKEVRQKGVTSIKVSDTARALGEIACFNRKRFKSIPVIAVTGSNGKTTAKEMIAGVLSRKFKVLKNEGTKNNHIGLPLTLLKLDNSYDVAVLEIGTNHFGEVEYLTRIAYPNIGVITNIGPAHLEYFRSLSGVFKEKSSLLRGLQNPAIAILNSDDAFLRRVALKKTPSPFILSVGLKHKSDFFASGISYVRGRPVFKVNPGFKFALKTLGYYNIYNSLFAIAVGRIFGLSYRDISCGLAGSSLPGNRLNFIEIEGVRFIDDTYNSNPLSLRHALGVLDNFSVRGKKIFVMGDMLELGDLSRALHAQAIREALKVADTLITVGELTRACLNKNSSAKNKIFSCGSAIEARRVLFEKVGVTPDDIVLVKGSRRIKMEEVLKI
ncbi:MAG: UDP-N-acetylmuramoyl-tripeptide--D-alanyl-D-alanine ligase [Candidatus Omnitrophica bacterium]|nr:UDP-N-acetylmuramoyl-tripeptide--D-alanyl-D-alanine ligase [Candidatus Omnitrophota bacterium]MDD5026889.1 UDP-N-acetylmuramoyl-tripeptide--D-alanyl-D-alanine ligase [Candidatus Omnitrophota bacterium]MDD5662179.1 UDP-N-acetylmuramoyl-tripeptide--D-alanyl-D-alanine ligase [Candidatus Omnitrophota bacterium]